MLLFKNSVGVIAGTEGTGKVFDIPRKDIACAAPFRYGISNRVFKVRHRAHECGMNICTLHVRKGDDLGKLFDPLLCFCADWNALRSI